MKKKLLIIIISCLLINRLPGQKLIINVKTTLPVYTSLSTSELNYYFADDQNSHYTVKPENLMKVRSYFTINAGVKYYFNDNWFTGYDICYLPYIKVLKINYNAQHINNINIDTRFNYHYLSNTLLFGYRMLRTKEIRPFVYTGISSYSLLRFNEVTRRTDEYKLINQEIYGQIIHQDIESIRNSFLCHTIGVGLEYYALVFNLTYDYSVTPTGVNNNIYNTFNSVHLSAGINLYNILIKTKKVLTIKQE